MANSNDMQNADVEQSNDTKEPTKSGLRPRDSSTPKNLPDLSEVKEEAERAENELDLSIIRSQMSDFELPNQDYPSNNRCFTDSSRTRSSSRMSNNDSQRINITLERSTNNQSNDAESREENEPPTVVCCSAEEPEEFQVDLCPRAWFDCSQGFFSAIWKICFVLFCLPFCYPCYLTRKFRRKRKRIQEMSRQEGSRSQRSRTMTVIKAQREEEEEA